jgi:hypothetical protein
VKRWRPRSLSARALFAVALVALVGAALFIALRGSDGVNRTRASDPAPGRSEAAGFAALSAAHTNRCDLTAMEVGSMPDAMRLQGSCCFPMDRSRYRSQLRGLGQFTDAERRLIPSNPYDVPVALAKRLLSYRAISLSPGQQTIYRRAAAKSSLGGPCCCHCWRWQAFKGQAEFLIARRHYSAAQVARLWELEAGCGGNDSAQAT